MEPIILNGFGAELRFEKLSKKIELTEESKLGVSLCGIGNVIGTHRGSWLYLLSESKTYKVLYCKNHCGLRIVIPNEVDTYGKLRQWCQDQINSKSARASEVSRIIADNK